MNILISINSPSNQILYVARFPLPRVGLYLKDLSRSRLFHTERLRESAQTMSSFLLSFNKISFQVFFSAFRVSYKNLTPTFASMRSNQRYAPHVQIPSFRHSLFFRLSFSQSLSTMYLFKNSRIKSYMAIPVSTYYYFFLV